VARLKLFQIAYKSDDIVIITRPNTTGVSDAEKENKLQKKTVGDDGHRRAGDDAQRGETP
jgi:hypothetical protein